MKKSHKAIEELARLEQRLALKKGKFVNLLNTEIVRQLSQEEKKDFFNYLKYKKIKPKLLALIFVLFFSGLFALRKGIVGMAVSETAQSATITSFFFVVLLVLLAVVFLISKLADRNLMKKFRDYVEIAEKRISA